jgi:hypothetical protein
MAVSITERRKIARFPSDPNLYTEEMRRFEQQNLGGGCSDRAIEVVAGAFSAICLLAGAGCDPNRCPTKNIRRQS